MEINIFQIDAFADRIFGGNPAAVCPLEDWLGDDVLAAIANENNLSETAFFVAEGDGYRLRWFTPRAEVDLCGHATLAAAKVILDILQPGGASVLFQTLSGALTVTRGDGGLFEMDFPAWPPVSAEVDAALIAGLGGAPREVLRDRDVFVVYGTEREVAALDPQISVAALHTACPKGGVIVTAPGEDGETDFVSRFFAPHLGIAEDPVTGSAHCSLVPYWAGRLGRNTLVARQISARGGTIHATLSGDRVLLRGNCVLYLEGAIRLP